MSKPLWMFDACELATTFRQDRACSKAALESTLARIEDVNGTLNVFAHQDVAGARRAAEASDVRAKAGNLLGPLDGIVLTIKDNIAVRDMPCAWGTELFCNFVPETDELPVARLRAQGAVILGKTNVSAFTLGQGTVSTAAFGTTRNPWDPKLTTGASSGGAASAVAAGIGAVALGTDGGGSIRRPASHCGLVGLKPSTGRVARRNGLPIILHDCEVVGPLARTVEDLALVYSAIAGPDPLDRASLAFVNRPATIRGEPRRRRKILYVPQFGSHPVDPEVAASCHETAELLSSLGHDVQHGKEPFDLARYEECWPVVSQAGLAWLLRGRDWKGLIPANHATVARQGGSYTAMDYVDALAGFRTIQAELGVFFQDYDILLTPAVGAVPWPAEDNGPPHERVFTGFANAAGIPAMVVPGPQAANGMPIGFQLIAAFGREDILFDLAREFEQVHPWPRVWTR